MRDKKYCNIVEDILPTYIENLTSEETNKFIEEHIKNCEECKKILQDMKEDVILEKIDKKVELNGLIKVKKRIRFQIAISIIFVILISCMCIYINNNYKIYINEDNKLTIKSTRSNFNISNDKYLIIKAKKLREEETKDNYLYVTHIITFNDKRICTNMRYIEDGYTDYMLNEAYNRYKDNEIQGMQTNVELKNGKLLYNSNFYNGKDINYIISDFKEYYNEMEFIEL